MLLRSDSHNASLLLDVLPKHSSIGLSRVAIEATYIGNTRPEGDNDHGPKGQEDKVAGMKLTINSRPPTPRNHSADRRSDNADEHGTQDVSGLSSRVKQPGGGAHEQTNDGEYQKVPHALIFLIM
jgi:hypothetical protein